MLGCRRSTGKIDELILSLDHSDTYRGTGFLNYWTLSNIPLFMLAMPMLYVLLYSGYRAWNQGAVVEPFANEPHLLVSPIVAPQIPATSPNTNIDTTILRRLALPQMVLAVLALTSYHVQIISRLASGYPIWYWWLTSSIIEAQKASFGRIKVPSEIITRWMVMYAIIQGGLFASFMPPA